jgi:hypothetical protein
VQNIHYSGPEKKLTASTRVLPSGSVNGRMIRPYWDCLKPPPEQVCYDQIKAAVVLKFSDIPYPYNSVIIHGDDIAMCSELLFTTNRTGYISMQPYF